MAVIEKNALIQVALIEDLLDISRIISGKLTLDLKPLSLTPIVVLKLDFINRLVAHATGRAPMTDGEQEGLQAMMAVLALPADPGDEQPLV